VDYADLWLNEEADYRAKSEAPAMSLPAIGITLDSEEPGSYSKFPWYAVRENYASAVAAGGGLPLMLPHELGRVDEYLDLMSGLLVTGGAFDVDPSLFGAKSTHPSVVVKSHRTDFEWAMTEGALTRNMPVLGICGGQQLLNVVLGGTLIQHIPDEIENALAHEQPNPRDEAGHDAKVVKDTLLYSISRNEDLSVNSAHHQAVKDVGDNVVINAVAPDGVIEGIESSKYAFCLGVQWHPEFSIDPADRKIFQAFAEAAANYR
jgi:putative glutamine amidotransferase